MIYPTSIKELELNPYSYLRNEFIDKLSSANLLVVVGYSFRDKELLNIVRDMMKANLNLWLLIADLEPENIKKRLLVDNHQEADRIITLSIDSKDAFGKRILNDQVDYIIDLKDKEEYFFSVTSQYSSPQWQTLKKIITICIKLNHFYRIKSLIEQILRVSFKERINPIPQLVNQVFRYSLRFGIESCIEQDWKNAEVWFQFFAFRILDTELNEFQKIGNLEKGKKKISDQLGINYIHWMGGANPEELEDLIRIDLDNYVKLDVEIKDTIERIIEAINVFISFMRISTNDPKYPNERLKFFQWVSKEGIAPFVIKLLKLISSKLKDNESLINRWKKSLRLL